MQGCSNTDDFKSFFVVEKILHLFEFEKWRTIRASVGGVGSVLAWVAWMACLRVWCASVGGVVT